MRTEQYSTAPLIEAFRNNLVLSHESIASVLGTGSKMTIFRKLKALEYCTSYSDAGRYYVLKRFISFDENGLWSKDAIRFSQAGSLMRTIPGLVEKSLQGYFAVELRALLHVKVQDALVKLFHEEKLERRQLRGEYLYLSPTIWRDQLRQREVTLEEGIRVDFPESMSQDVVDHMRWLLTVLNEKQSRLYLGFESMREGHGGDAVIARITGVNVKTVARGRHELEQRQSNPERIRNAGAGRPAIKKKPK